MLLHAIRLREVWRNVFLPSITRMLQLEAVAYLYVSSLLIKCFIFRFDLKMISLRNKIIN
jgi:hypothetical protein